jgi:hypothetical protein
MSSHAAASRASVSAARDTAPRARPPTSGDAEGGHHLEKKLTVLWQLLPLLRVLRQRVIDASDGTTNDAL